MEFRLRSGSFFIFTTILGAVLISAGFFCLLIFFFTGFPWGLRLFDLLLAAGCLVYGPYFLAFPLKTRLVISDQGVFYTQPLYAVSGEWQDVKGILYTERSLLLGFRQYNRAKANRLVRALFGRPYDDIPLHFFAKGWSQPEDWQRSEVLRAVEKYMPEVSQAFVKK